MLQHSFIVGGFTVIQQIIASAQQNVLFLTNPTPAINCFCWGQELPSNNQTSQWTVGNGQSTIYRLFSH
jgi:hypothetical protein